MLAWDRLRPFWRVPSLVVLVAANVVPLVGVLALGWKLADVMLLFWVENAIVGLFTVLKMAFVGSWKAVVLVPFFILHYGFFMFGHLIFLTIFFVVGLDPNQSNGGSLGLVADALVRTSPAIVALVGSHGASFVLNFLPRERKEVSIEQLMMAPYARIVVLHVTIIFGGFAILVLGQPIAALALLVALKTGVDAVAHVRERAKQAPTPTVS